jgi:hypothetical protein
MGRRRHDDPPGAPRLPPPRLARRDHRPHRRERLGDRRPLDRRAGLPLHEHEVLPAARDTVGVQHEPADPACTFLRDSCGVEAMRTARSGPYDSPTDWGYDLNLRHVHMQAEVRARSAVSAHALRQRSHLADGPRSQRRVSGEFGRLHVGNNDCTNPLFASSLPTAAQLSSGVASQEATSDATTLCNLPAGIASTPARSR